MAEEPTNEQYHLEKMRGYVSQALERFDNSADLSRTISSEADQRGIDRTHVDSLIASWMGGRDALILLRIYNNLIDDSEMRAQQEVMDTNFSKVYEQVVSILCGE